MNARTICSAGGLAGLGLMLVALPGPSQTTQSQNDRALYRLEQRLAEMQVKLAGMNQKQDLVQLDQERAALLAQRAADQAQERLDEAEPLLDSDTVTLLGAMDEGTSWLGVETREVTPDTAKQLKLPAERGVVLSRITPDSPAAKAGLKENDIVTEINGQRVEGVVQFRRVIREIPAGRTVQLTVWRDAHAQTISVTLGKSEERPNVWARAFPSRDFAFHLPEIQIPDIPALEFFPGNRPRLGIDAEDLSGQLGSYFGAPDGEGVLVRSVNPGSPAEKAGLKAGDVIVKFNEARIRTVGDLREQLAAIHESKSAKLGVLRNKSEITLDVTVEPPASPKISRPAHRTNI